MLYKRDELVDLFNNIEVHLDSSNNILLTGHKLPDGDAIGSVLAWYFFLKDRYKGEKIVSMVIPSHIPIQYKWMSGIDDIIIAEYNIEKARKAFDDADLIIANDFNEPGRIDVCGDWLMNSSAVKINIDHHPLGFDGYDVIYNDIDAASVCEMVFNVIYSIDSKSISKTIAECLYVGIITDTGSLSYSCNDACTYETLSILFEQNINGSDIQNKVFNNFPLDKTKLLGYILNDKLVVDENYHLAYITVTLDELDRFNYQTGYLSNMVNKALYINNIFVAASFVERKSFTKISFRSKGDIDVNEIAVKYFGGGGHHNASGADFYGSIDEAVKIFVDVVKSMQL